MIASALIFAVLVAFGGLVAAIARYAKTGGAAEVTHDATMERIDGLLEIKRQDDIVSNNPNAAVMRERLSNALRKDSLS
jgi:hypothetical protein